MIRLTISYRSNHSLDNSMFDHVFGANTMKIQLTLGLFQLPNLLLVRFRFREGSVRVQ